MRNLDDLLKRRKIDNKKLIDYGFKNNKDTFTFETEILNGSFLVCVKISDKEKTSKVIEKDMGEEYVLVDVEEAIGEFVGKVRYEYEAVLKDIIEKCSETEIFKRSQTKKAINYILEKYKDELEFPWDDENMIIRNKETKKWYALFMIIPKSRLGIESGDEVEALNLHTTPELSEIIVDEKGIFHGYHMNKKSWITVLLDGSLPDRELFDLIDNSYALSEGSSKMKQLSKKVYEYLRTIPKGKVVTYGQIASYLGNKGLARIVGTILHNNPDGDKNPCYKVLNNKGELAESFVFGGKNVQKKRLEKDGIEVKDNRVDMKKYQWKEG